MTAFLRRLTALTVKELRQISRDPSSIMIGLALPIILILIFGYGLSLDVNNAPVAVVCLCIQSENVCKMPWGFLRVRSRKWINDVTVGSAP